MSYYTGSSYTFGLAVQGSSMGSVIASAFSADRVGGDTLPVPHTDPFTTFCLDIDTVLGNGWWKSGSFSEVPLTSDSGKIRQGVASLQYAAELYKNFAGTIPAGGWNAVQKAEGSALQLAIWEVLYEYSGTGGFDVYGGSGFRTTSGSSSIRDRANEMLDTLTWGTPDISLTTTFWNAIKSQTNTGARSSQDLIGPIAPVPEPTTVVAGALLLLPFLASTVRFKRRS